MPSMSDLFPSSVFGQLRLEGSCLCIHLPGQSLPVQADRVLRAGILTAEE